MRSAARTSGSVCLLWLMVSCGSGSPGGPSPLQLEISPRKPAFVAGESIRIDISQQTLRRLEMETVELNRDRTLFLITQADSQWALTGRDYAARFGIAPTAEVGTRFVSPAGGVWRSTADLLAFRGALAPGAYGLRLVYRFGDAAADTAASNAIAFDVQPARVQSLTRRWFAGGSSREVLGTLWTSSLGGRTGVYLQASLGRRPDRVHYSTHLVDWTGDLRIVPRLAALLDAAHSHFLRYVVWLEPGSIRWLAAQPEGAMAGTQQWEHPLHHARLVDPPLQTGADGLLAVVVGSDSTGSAGALYMQMAPGVEPTGSWRPLAAAAGRASALLWTEAGARPVLYYDVPGREGTGAAVAALDLENGESRVWPLGVATVLALVPYQRHQAAHVLGVGSTGDSILTFRLPPANAPGSRKWISSYARPMKAELVAVEPTASGDDLSHLLREASGWIIHHKGGRFSLRADACPIDVTPELVLTEADTVYVLYQDDLRGLTAVPVLP